MHWVPESAALGIPALVAAAYLRRIRRRRSQVRAARGDDEIVVAPDPAAVALEARLTPFADAPALEWLELANRHLTAALRSEGTADEAPGITVVRVGPAGVELLLDAAVDWAPGAFTLTDDGHTWLLGSDVDREALWPSARDELAWLPLLVPVGDDPSGTYLLHLEPGQEVSLEGPQAKAMLAAWARGGQVLAVGRAGERGGRRRGGRITGAVVRRADQCRRAGHGHVRGRAGPVVRRGKKNGRHGDAGAERRRDACGGHLRAGVHRALRDHGATVPARRSESADVGRHLRRPVEDPEPLKTAMEIRRRTTSDSDPMASGAEIGGPGPIEVQLLTFTPEIVGLAAPLSSNMVVRITELVAWVALQGQKGTTAASMVDHGIVGATATKTVYNMVSAARAALGVDASGAPLLITDRSTGTYRLSEEVTVDVLRFEQMAERGIDAEDPQLAALLCEAALALIDDTPVGNGTGRYGWWSSMWEARIGRLATKAAGRLAELARHGVIDIEVARWGIERARLTAGGEEALHRVAMVLEAWAGNDARSSASGRRPVLKPKISNPDVPRATTPRPS